ncbi:MAG: DNA-binding protein, partial [Neisseria elongata]
GKGMRKRTFSEAKLWLKEQNITVAQWARENGHNSVDVSRVLNGKSKCRYGQAREIALKLNIDLKIVDA